MNAGYVGKPWANRRGTALFEFALILPLFLVITIGLMEFARAFNIWQVVVNAAREGARAVALPQGSQSNDPLIVTRVSNYMQSNNLDACNAGNTTCTIVGVTGIPGSMGSVTVNYQYTFNYFGGVIKLIGGSSASTVTISSTSTMRNE